MVKRLKKLKTSTRVIKASTTKIYVRPQTYKQENVKMGKEQKILSRNISMLSNVEWQL